VEGDDMSKKNVTRYFCDVRGCTERAESDFRNGVDDGPPLLGWGFIRIGKLRGHSNVSMWLCPSHFKTIDEWWYVG
jgi:hypothetical protein